MFKRLTAWLSGSDHGSIEECTKQVVSFITLNMEKLAETDIKESIKGNSDAQAILAMFIYEAVLAACYTYKLSIDVTLALMPEVFRGLGYSDSNAEAFPKELAIIKEQVQTPSADPTLKAFVAFMSAHPDNPIESHIRIASTQTLSSIMKSAMMAGSDDQAIDELLNGTGQ